MARLPAKRWLFAVAVVCALVAAWFALRRAPRADVVRAVRVDAVQTVVASGRVLAAADVELGVKGVGRALSVHIKEGQRVGKGDLLVTLDDAEAKAAIAEARASVMGALVEVRRVRQKAAPLARASLLRAEGDVEYAEQELLRSQQLAGAGASSSQQLEQARQSVSLARTRRDIAQVELASALPAGADRDLAVASLRHAEASLELAATRLADTQLTAPAAGTVIAVNVDPGESVQAGSALVRMVLDGPVQLEMEPDERNLALLRVGQLARASAEAFPDQTFDATLSYIAPAVDPARGTIRARFEVPAPPAYLRADMTVSIEVTVAQVPNALVLPLSAVRDLASKRAWVLTAEGGKAVRHDVVIGVRAESNVEIKSGLPDDALVLIDPELSPGARLRPVEQTP